MINEKIKEFEFKKEEIEKNDQMQIELEEKLEKLRLEFEKESKIITDEINAKEAMRNKLDEDIDINMDLHKIKLNLLIPKFYVYINSYRQYYSNDIQCKIKECFLNGVDFEVKINGFMYKICRREINHEPEPESESDTGSDKIKYNFNHELFQINLSTNKERKINYDLYEVYNKSPTYWDKKYNDGEVNIVTITDTDCNYKKIVEYHNEGWFTDKRYSDFHEFHDSFKVVGFNISRCENMSTFTSYRESNYTDVDCNIQKMKEHLDRDSNEYWRVWY